MASSLDELDVKVYIDYPQYRRNVKAPFTYVVDGTSVDASTAVNCYIEPVTRTVMGKPVPMTPEWKTTFTGQGFTRFQKADFTFSSPSSWGNIFFYGTNDCYLYCASNSSVITSAPVQLNGGVSRNQPLFFSYIKQDKKSSNTNITAKLFWASSSFNNTDTQLHFKDDGSCDIYRGYILKSGTILCTTSTAVVTGSLTLFTSEIPGASVLYTEDGRLIGTVSTITNNTTLTLTAIPSFNYAGQYHIKQPLKVASYSRNENNYNQQAVKITHSNPNNDYNDVFIMPMRGKELVVNTSFGLNFSHTFDDLMDPNEPAKVTGFYGGLFFGVPVVESTPAQLFMLPEILPTGDFSIVIPNQKAAFQLAKLYFLSNWSIDSNIIYNEVAQQGLKNMGYRTETTAPGLISCTTTSNIILGSGTSFDSSYLNGRLLNLKPNATSTIEIGTVSTVVSPTVISISGVANAILTSSQYYILKKKTGTITASTSSNIITGVGTLFNTEVALFDDFYDANDNYLGKVQSISSNTSLSLYYNSMTDVSAGVYWLNYPMISSISTNPQTEIMGVATSTQYSDVINTTSPSVQIYFNNTSTDTVFNATYAKLKLTQVSASDPTNSLKNNDSTTIFYSSDVVITWKPQKTKTTQVDITSVVESLSVERKETGEMGCVFSARKQNLIDLGVVNPEKLSNRSIKITMKPRDVSYDERVIFDGFLHNPEIEYIQGINYDKYSLLTFEGYDKKQTINDVYFTKAPSYDSLDYQDVMLALLKYSGVVENDFSMSFNLSLQGYDLGINRNNSNGQYNWTPNVSDSVGGFIEKLRSELSQNMVFYTQKTFTFDDVLNRFLQSDGYFFTDTSNKADAINFTIPLYLSETSANTYGSIPLNKAYKRTIRNLKKTYEAPEANQVIVIGLDKTNNNRITSIIDDVDSQNPTITNRPNNWLGNVSSATIVNDRLNSLNQVSKTAGLLFKKISSGREIIEFTSDMITYFDDYTKAPNSIPANQRTGFITSSTSSNAVTGLGTSFIAELVVGSLIYSANGVLVGTVATIVSNTSLTLTTVAATTLSLSKYTIGLSGTIDSFTYTNVVSGVGTLFTTQLKVGNFLYSPDGYLIGQISTIVSNTSLTLTSNGLYAVSSSLYYISNPFKWLYQYDFQDLQNAFELKNLDGTSDGYYKIIGWKADFIKNNIPVYISGILQKPDQINVVQCSYRAMKITNLNQVPIVERDFVNRYFENSINVLKSTLSKVMLVVSTISATTTVSLSGAPSGMTFYTTNNGLDKIIIIQWTPSVGQTKSTFFVNVNITNPTGSGNSYTIPLTFKVFDTL